MKLTNLALIATIVFVCFVIIDDLRIKELEEVSRVQIKMNNVLDNAVEDAMVHLVEVDNGLERIVNKEYAVEAFYTNMYINLDMMENPAKKAKLRGYIPVIALVLDDGFYFYYQQMMEKEGTLLMQSVFSEKYPYIQVYESVQISYTLGDYIYYTDLDTGEKLEGDYHDISELHPEQEFLKEEFFDKERRNVIITHLKETITEYMNQHNKIAQQFGIQYEFALPYIEEEEWYRTIDDISMIAFFQGYPYHGSQSGYYNRVAVGGARVRKVTE